MEDFNWGQLAITIGAVSFVVQWVVDYIRRMVPQVEGAWSKLVALVVSLVAVALWRYNGSDLIAPMGDISILDTALLVLAGSAGSGAVADYLHEKKAETAAARAQADALSVSGD